jgi:N-acyl-D-amino-acid deacylase
MAPFWIDGESARPGSSGRTIVDVDYSVLIEGGDVIDGTGASGRRADVLVRNGRIEAVGAFPDTVDAARISACGRVVAPGFVDIHSHADFTVLAFPSAESAVMQGVTTVVTGNCGGGVAPTSPRHDVRRVAFGYQPDWGIDIGWSSFPEYLSRLRGLAVNVAPLVPHGAVRNAVLGLVSRAPTAREMERMRGIVAEALDAGAAGLSTGLEYQPGCFAGAEEITKLAALVADRGGLYATHMRDRGDAFAAATEEALAVSAATGVRLQLSHVAPRPYAAHDEVERAFGAIETARSDGNSVYVDTFPETWGPGLLADLFPREAVQGAPRTIARRLRDPGTRRQVAEFFAAGRNFLVRAGGYETIFIASSPTDERFIGRSLPELADGQGTSIAEWCCDAMAGAGARMMSFAIRHVYAREEDLRRVLSLSFCSLGSDGVVTAGEGSKCAYLWNASTYGYVPRALRHYVAEERVFTLEEAVRRLSQLPAEAAGLKSRGIIAPGAAADLVVFDPDGLRDRSTPEDMARFPQGIEHVLVNGIPVVRAGRATGARPGGLVAQAAA